MRRSLAGTASNCLKALFFINALKALAEIAESLSMEESCGCGLLDRQRCSKVKTNDDFPNASRPGAVLSSC